MSRREDDNLEQIARALLNIDSRLRAIELWVLEWEACESTEHSLSYDEHDSYRDKTKDH